MKGYYLNKINICLEDLSKEVLDGIRCFKECLEAEGITAVVRQAGRISDMQLDEALENKAHDRELWFSDSEQLVKRMLVRKLPVVAYLHQGNRNSLFAEVRYAVERPQELSADYFDKVYRRFLGIPWYIAETARCLIRETIPEDARSFREIYQDSEITRFMEEDIQIISMEQEPVRDAIQKGYEFYGYGIWTVIYKETQEVIGRVGFQSFDDRPQLGYMIAVPYQRQGLAEEVCRAVIDYAKEQLYFEQIQVLIREENKASLGLAKKLGFEMIETVYKDRNRFVRAARYVNT